MITCKEYFDWYERAKRRMLDSGHYASEPTFLFIDREGITWGTPSDLQDWEFCPENWCGGDIVRNYIYEHLETLQLPGYDCRWYHIDDEWRVFFFSDSHFYEIGWYKSRGRTDFIRKDGNPITMGEYVDLYNALAPCEPLQERMA